MTHSFGILPKNGPAGSSPDGLAQTCRRSRSWVCERRIFSSESLIVMKLDRRRPLDRPHDARVGPAAAEILGERRLDLVRARLGVLGEQGGGLHDHAVD